MTARGIRCRFGRLAGVASATALMAAMSACGIPTEDRPRVIRPESVPFDLLDRSNIDAPAEADIDPREAVVFLVKSENKQLVLRSRKRRLAPPVNLDTVVRNLMAGGITPKERAEQLANLVPAREVRQVTTSNAVAVIDVTEDFFPRLPKGREGRLAIAQIVLTVTDFKPTTGERVTSVRFTVKGAGRSVPDASGRTKPAVGLADYRDLVGPQVEPETTAVPTTSTPVPTTSTPVPPPSTSRPV